jgi:hypothetical protein
MMKGTIALLVIALGSVCLSGCEKEAPQQSAASTTETAVAQAVALPADFFSAEPLADATTLLAVKSSAKKGDQVTFVAAIGGRANPFIAERAVMVVADLELPFCTDGCPKPWDACCAPSEDIGRLTATVQVTDADGNPLKVGLEGLGELKPGAEIQVQGIVERAEEGAYIVTAQRLHVSS